jgi:hypothetical protein
VTPAGDAAHDGMRRIAEQLEASNPRWIVVFGAYTKQFIAFSRFHAPEGTIITARYPDALPSRLRIAEERHAVPPPSEPPTIRLARLAR